MAPTISITILDGSLAGKKISFTEPGECVIGRSTSCKISFSEGRDKDYAKVSGRHCLLDIAPPYVRIKKISDNKALISGEVIGTEFQVVNFSDSDGEILKLGEDDVRIKITLTGNRLVDRGIDGVINIGGKVGENSEKLASGIKKISPFAKPVFNWVLDFMDMGERPSQLQVEIQEQKQEQPQSKSIDNSAKNKISTPLEIRQYNICGSLGKSGFEEVFLATTPKGKKVVVKTMLSDANSNSNELDRFEREMDNIKNLNHNNVVKSIDRGIQSNTLYYVMEYCEAGSLDRTIDQMGGKLPLDLAKSIIVQVLDGLEYIHTVELQVKTEEDGYKQVRGMVHRDLQPKNILLTVDRLNLVAKIGSFGLSKSFENAGNSGITSVGDRVLGVHYFSSRQQFKDSLNSKPEVDVWAAAACLYYMLTGEYPRDFCDDIDIDKTMIEQPAISIKARNSDIPDRLAEVIDRALNEDKELFYKTAKDLKQAILASIDQNLAGSSVALIPTTQL